MIVAYVLMDWRYVEVRKSVHFVFHSTGPRDNGGSASLVRLS